MKTIKVLFTAFLLVGTQSYYAAENGALPGTDNKQGISKTATSSVDPHDASAELQYLSNAMISQPEKRPGTPYGCPSTAVKAANPSSVISGYGYWLNHEEDD